MTDEMLAERTRQGSGRAFATLVAKHCDAVYRIAENICASVADAEKVTRLTFISAYRDASSRPGGVSFRTWLYGIAMSTAMRQRQDAARRPPVSLEAYLPRFDADGDLEQVGADWPELARDRLQGMNVTGLLREALDCMDPDVRGAFVLHDLVELPAEEAATITQTSAEVVRRRAHRARLMLRGFLDRLWSA
jgi:RNA polymerase sigma factor (sigma-70 family)